MTKVFILYSRKDKDFVEKLKHNLINDGISVTDAFDPIKFNVGQLVSESILKELNAADYALVIISPNYSGSGDMFFLGMAEALKNNNFVIPLKIDKSSKIPFDLMSKQYVDFSNSFEEAYYELANFFKKQEQQKQQETIKIDKLVQGIVTKAKSYENLKDIIGAYNNGNLVLFCGAGISYDAGIPTWNKLLEELLERFVGETDKRQISKSDLANLFQNKLKVSPLILGKHLKFGLGDEFTTIVRDILYQDCNDNSKTIDEIVELSRARRNRKTLKAIITFNFDDLIEKKMKNEKIDYRTIFAEGERFEENEIPIYHPHGFLPRNIKLTKDNEIVFSEDTYHTQFIDPFSWGNLVQLNYLNNSTCLFVGISLTDPNMRRLLDVSMRKNGKNEKNHYIIRKHYTNYDLYSDTKNKVDSENKMLKLIEHIEEKDANSLGFNVIWVDEFSEIPEILNNIYSV